MNLLKQITLLLSTVLIMLVPIQASAALDDKKFAIGIDGGGLLVYGLSAKMRLSNKMTGQVVLGGLGDITTMGGRVIYKFLKEPEYNIYSYGGLGLLMKDASGFGFGLGNLLKEDVAGSDDVGMGISLGVGAEYDIRAFDSNLPAVSLSLELGFVNASFEDDAGTYGAISIATGIHYNF